MNRLIFSIIILFSFMASQSYALVCKSSCLTHSEASVDKNHHSDMPDCHSSQDQQTPEKEDSHSCSKTCQTDFLESQYTGPERSSLKEWADAQPVFVTQNIFELSVTTEVALTPVAPPPRWTSVSIFLIQQKFLI